MFGEFKFKDSSTLDKINSKMNSGAITYLNVSLNKTRHIINQKF